jgi:3-phenylpropionate/trans-cinnamate dioxygenase ferredoxin reductase subunit
MTAPCHEDQVVYRGDPATFAFIAFGHSGGTVIAGMNVNVWDVAGGAA